ncbi:hypothetical protein A6037_04665 [[Haemophilus] ducreyi]|nr:hypothetical protein A6037_04665 [[Haemophilus] ducreyi]
MTIYVQNSRSFLFLLNIKQHLSKKIKKFLIKKLFYLVTVVFFFNYIKLYPSRKNLYLDE